MVGVKGLEPPAPWSQTMCATKLRYTPTLFFITMLLCYTLVGRDSRTRTYGIRFWRPTFHQLNYIPIRVGLQGFEPRTYRL